MSFYDYYLSVPSEADIPDIPDGATIDILGYLQEDPSGPFFFNVRSKDPLDFHPSVTKYTPNTPWRVWA